MFFQNQVKLVREKIASSPRGWGRTVPSRSRASTRGCWPGYHPRGARLRLPRSHPPVGSPYHQRARVADLQQQQGREAYLRRYRIHFSSFVGYSLCSSVYSSCWLVGLVFPFFRCQLSWILDFQTHNRSTCLVRVRHTIPIRFLPLHVYW
jgi:hypothetical protein